MLPWVQDAHRGLADVGVKSCTAYINSSRFASARVTSKHGLKVPNLHFPELCTCILYTCIKRPCQALKAVFTHDTALYHDESLLRISVPCDLLLIKVCSNGYINGRAVHVVCFPGLVYSVNCPICFRHLNAYFKCNNSPSPITSEAFHIRP